MAEFLKKLRQNANLHKEIPLPDGGYYKGSPFSDDPSVFLKHIEREKKKAMEHFLTAESDGRDIRLSDMVHRVKSTARPSSRYAMMDEVSPSEVVKGMKKLAESVHSSSYEKFGLHGWFDESESKYDAPNFFEKPKAKPQSVESDIPLTQTDMVW